MRDDVVVQDVRSRTSKKWGGEGKEAETDRGVGGTGVLLRPGTLLGAAFRLVRSRWTETICYTTQSLRTSQTRGGHVRV